MIPLVDEPPHWIMLIGLALFAAGLIAALWRLLLGPTLPDRVIALDLLGLLVVSLICVTAVITSQSALLAVALVAALILFLGTAAFAIYLQRRAAP
jgi:multicomponent Na+:H+ antiporter subunit F